MCKGCGEYRYICSWNHLINWLGGLEQLLSCLSELPCLRLIVVGTAWTTSIVKDLILFWSVGSCRSRQLVWKYLGFGALLSTFYATIILQTMKLNLWIVGCGRLGAPSAFTPTPGRSWGYAVLSTWSSGIFLHPCKQSLEWALFCVRNIIRTWCRSSSYSPYWLIPFLRLVDLIERAGASKCHWRGGIAEVLICICCSTGQSRPATICGTKATWYCNHMLYKWHHRCTQGTETGPVVLNLQ